MPWRYRRITQVRCSRCECIGLYLASAWAREDRERRKKSRVCARDVGAFEGESSAERRAREQRVMQTEGEFGEERRDHQDDRAALCFVTICISLRDHPGLLLPLFRSLAASRPRAHTLFLLFAHALSLSLQLPLLSLSLSPGVPPRHGPGSRGARS